MEPEALPCKMFKIHPPEQGTEWRILIEKMKIKIKEDRSTLFNIY